MNAGTRRYRAVHPATAFTAQNDLWEVVGSSSRITWVCGWIMEQGTEVGDAAEEKILMQWISGHATSGNGTARTPRPNGADAAFGGTVESNGTTIASTGSPVTEWEGYWDVRQSNDWIFDEDSWLLVPASARWVLRIAAPGDSVTAASTLLLAEAG